MTKEELRQKRINLGLTQIELAEELDVKNNTVARWESGVLPTIPKMVELAMQAVEMNHGKASAPVKDAPASAKAKRANKEEAKLEKMKDSLHGFLGKRS